MKKRLVIFALLLTMLCTLFAPISVSAEENAPTYTVLVLDTSGDHKFYGKNSQLIYTAESALAEVKEAASTFATKLLSLNKNHYIAVVSYQKGASTVTIFTQDADTITKGISKLTKGGEDANISGALTRARNLFAEVGDKNAVKNIVLFSTGYHNSGDYASSGKYDKNTPASDWFNRQTKKYLYQYANVAVKTAESLHEDTSIYTVGLLQNWNGMPKDGADLLTFYKMFLKDLSNPASNFHPVYSKQDLDGAFADICNDIIDNPFDDATYESYFWDAVIWAGEEGITTGTTEDTFTPDESCTREQMVTFLWRAAGQPEPTKDTRFKDLDPNSSWSYKAICWADENGITQGTSATTFSPKATVTREQVVTLLWRLDGGKTAGLDNPFVDVSVGQYSYDAILWAFSNAITTGIDSRHFGPANPCTRAQIVTFMYRYYT